MLFGETAGTPSSAVFGGEANRRFRRFAGNGESVIVTFRPAIFGSIST
jgi:hypothetical protein